MRESPVAVSSRSMAFTDNITASDMEKRGINRKNWRMRIGFFLKTNISPSPRKNRSYRPTVDDMNQWGLSLDKLLSHKYGKEAFCIFLKSEFCEENIEFWTACEDFRAITSQVERTAKANSIFEEFIKSETPKEINLDFHTKNAIVQSLSEPSDTSFIAAQKKVYSLMENNSYPRFIHSDLYKDLYAAAKAEAKHIKP